MSNGYLAFGEKPSAAPQGTGDLVVIDLADGSIRRTGYSANPVLLAVTASHVWTYDPYAEGVVLRRYALP